MLRKFILRSLEKHASHWVVLIIDILLVSIAFILAYYVRFNASLDFNTASLLYQLPFVSLFFFISFWIVGSYKGIIRHTGTKDAFNVFLGVSIASFFVLSITLIKHVFKILPEYSFPISIILIHYFVSVFLLILSRFIFKAFYEIISSELNEITNVLIYGAGESGLITAGVLNRDSRNQYEIIGFIDDDKSKVGKKIERIKIHARRDITEEFVKNKKIDEVILSFQNVKSERLLFLTDQFLKLGIKPKIVPPLKKWIDGDFSANQIKDVRIEDLLDRDPISIDNPIIQRDVDGKTILVTGAAGSIGSEISRQISRFNHKHLILVDQAESSLYEIQQELIRKGITNFTAIVADVRDKNRIDQIFEKFKPNKIYHAAAYKHVPLMELNPYESVNINICGTKNVADLSTEHNVEKFVMISTDKAVNPTNVMGATKRVAELYISCLSKQQINTKFITTRFGNVLGSNGSVIPLFTKQIKEGGPLTVTHKEITRYFMTIPEACQLVIEAGSMGNGGEIYIFDMGKSVKIYDIAKRMIHLSGLKFPEDIDIKISGLRPGEKLYEELLANGENTTPTYHKKIMIAKNQEINEKLVFEKIANLCYENKNLNNNNSVKLIKEIVPEYVSNNSEYEKLDKII